MLPAVTGRWIRKCDERKKHVTCDEEITNGVPTFFMKHLLPLKKERRKLHGQQKVFTTLNVSQITHERGWHNKIVPINLKNKSNATFL